MARVQTGSDIVLNPTPASGLDVVFGGVEVFEVKSRGTVGWKLALAAAALAGLIVTGVLAWAGVSHSAASSGQLRIAGIACGLAAIAALVAVAQLGVVWRFDHKRKSVCRKHWLHGAGRTWNSQKIKGIVLRTVKSRFGGEQVQLALVNGDGKPLAELGRWGKDEVDAAQVERVMQRIKDVMWWK